MIARRWLDWSPTRVSGDSERTDKTDKTSTKVASVSFGGASGNPKNTQADRITLAEAAADLARMHAKIARDWPEGAFAMLDADPDLRRRFEDAERTLDNLARTPGGPLRGDWTAAVAGLAAVLREIVDRYRARRETAHGGA